MSEHQTNPVACWNCHTVLDGHMNVNGSGAPETGDLSICIYCGAWGTITVTDRAVALSTPSPEEWLEITTNIERIESCYRVARFREANHIGVPAQ